jgi:hypothetical protein
MAFRRRAVLILGAGASAEAEMPVGGQLKEAIADALNFRKSRRNDLVSGDSDLYELIRYKFGNDANRYITAGAELARAIPVFISIDEALHFYSENPELVWLGKLEIVRQILKREGGSVLKLDPATAHPVLGNVGETWFLEFLSMALAGLRKDSLESVFQNVTIINFNYDRTLEHYLYWALQATASITAEIAASVRGVTI